MAGSGADVAQGGEDVGHGHVGCGKSLKERRLRMVGPAARERDGGGR